MALDYWLKLILLFIVLISVTDQVPMDSMLNLWSCIEIPPVGVM